MHKPIRITLIVFVVIATIVSIAYAMSLLSENSNKMTVVYRGEKFSIDQERPAFSKRQTKKITELLMQIDPPKTEKTLKNLAIFHQSTEVPGHASGFNGGGFQTDKGKFITAWTQLPDNSKYRIFIYWQKAEDQAYILAADFVESFNSIPNFLFEVTGNSILVKDSSNPSKTLETIALN